MSVFALGQNDAETPRRAPSDAAAGTPPEQGLRVRHLYRLPQSAPVVALAVNPGAVGADARRMSMVEGEQVIIAAATRTRTSTTTPALSPFPPPRSALCLWWLWARASCCTTR